MSIATMTEEQWEIVKQRYKTRLSTIVIPLDINAGIAKGILARIDAFFSEVRVELGELEGQKEKIESIIREWERAKATGTSDIVRKKNATEALQEYPMGNGQTVNMYEVSRQVAERTSFIRGIVDTLNGKQSRLITISGVLKIEKELSPHGNIL